MCVGSVSASLSSPLFCLSIYYVITPSLSLSISLSLSLSLCLSLFLRLSRGGREGRERREKRGEGRGEGRGDKRRAGPEKESLQSFLYLQSHLVSFLFSLTLSPLFFFPSSLSSLSLCECRCVCRSLGRGKGTRGRSGMLSHQRCCR